MSEILTLSCDKVIVRTSHFVSDKVRGEGVCFFWCIDGDELYGKPPLMFLGPL